MVKGEYYLPAVFMRMIIDGCRLAAPEIDAWLDTNAYLLKYRHHIHGDAHNCVFIEPVHIEKGVILTDSVIGPNVSIAIGSIIERSIVCNSIINGNSVVRNMVLTDTILGDAVQLLGSARRMNIGDHSLIEMQG